MVSNNAAQPAPEHLESSRRAAGPLRLAFKRAVQDWYYGLIPLGAINLLWLALVLTVVGGPPATAAMLAVARDAAVGYGAEPKNFFFYFRLYFWRAWALGFITLLGTIIFVTDIFFYAAVLSGNPFVFNLGVFFLLYVLVVWFEVLLIAWPLLVDRPKMTLSNVLRNAAVLTLRVPGANFGLALVVLLVCIFSLAFAVAVALALAAIVALLAQHYLHLQAPILANFPSRPTLEPDPETRNLWDEEDERPRKLIRARKLQGRR